MRERGRHPLFENLVFGLALVLALIIAFYGLQRTFKEGETPRIPGPEPHAPAAVKNTLEPSPTERSVSELPPIQLSRTGALKRRSPAVPSPVRKKD